MSNTVEIGPQTLGFRVSTAVVSAPSQLPGAPEGECVQLALLLVAGDRAVKHPT